jgi:ribosomal protein L37AE/L43A
MAKAMMKKGTEKEERVTQYLCPSCGDWDSTYNWTEHECYKYSPNERWSIADDTRSLIFDQGDVEDITVLQHDPCDNYFANVLEERQRGGPIWICGSCGWESRDKEQVMRCCL